MKNIILNLISEKKEGSWWDFKQKHHKNLSDLLHDILCLSNTIYDGDRYLIFGVSDNYEVVGVQDTENRRSQSDILDFLRKKSFSNHCIPIIELKTIIVNSAEIDVLIIKNEKLKPYYLTQDEKSHGRIIRAGAIYSRLQDTNTPIDSTANPYEVEAMWRERLGLNDKATEKFIHLLKDYENWVYDGYGKAFYDISPDYTIEIENTDEEGGKFWWEDYLPEKPSRFYYRLLFRNVEIHKVLAVRFHSENLTIPYPEIEYVTYPELDDGLIADCFCDLFYFVKSSISFSLFLHIRGTETNRMPRNFSTPIKSQIKPPIISLPFPFFESVYEFEDEIDKLRESFDQFIELSIKKFGTDKDESLRYKKEKLFSEWAFEQLKGQRM